MDYLATTLSCYTRTPSATDLYNEQCLHEAAVETADQHAEERPVLSPEAVQISTRISWKQPHFPISISGARSDKSSPACLKRAGQGKRSGEHLWASENDRYSILTMEVGASLYVSPSSSPWR